MKLHLPRVFRKIMWYSDSSECLGKVCLLCYWEHNL